MSHTLKALDVLEGVSLGRHSLQALGLIVRVAEHLQLPLSSMQVTSVQHLSGSAPLLLLLICWALQSHLVDIKENYHP